MPMPSSHHRRIRGTAMTLTIVVAVIISGMVAALSWTASVQSQVTGSMSQIDQAFFAAESGAQRVAWYCKNNKMSSITSPLTGLVNGYAYSASWTTVSGSTIKITSTGSLGSVSYAMSETVTPPASAAPALALGDNFDNKNMDITGDLITGGSYTNGGSGSLTGNLTYYSTASNTGSVTGTITHATGSFAFMDLTTLGNTLIAAAGQTYTGTQTNTTFNFTNLSGTNKVIYVNGPVVNPTFIGSGTLYSSGAVSSLNGFGSAGSPVNIVAQAAVTMDNNVTCYGSIYTGGAWGRGKISLTGIVYVSGAITVTNNGSSSLTGTAAPWFDPRGSGGGGGSTTTFASFAGPQP
jgi:hypothetical protein